MNISHLCSFCNLHELETVDHVITRCPLYDYERQSMLVNLQLGLSLTPLGLAAYHSIADLNQHALTLVLLGQHDPAWSLEVSALIHRVARQYFLVCWEKRVKMLGKNPGVTKDGYLTIHDAREAGKGE